MKTLKDFLKFKGRYIEEEELKAEATKIKNSCIKNNVFDLQLFGLKCLEFFEIKSMEEGQSVDYIV